MADSSIGSLPQAPQLDDDSLLVVEQQGQAMKINGAQFKEFGRQAVIGQVQGYVDQAEAAAERAADAVSAVTDMTVEARTLEQGQPATVTKTTKDGKVNLAFGLPRGAQGVPGPEGQTGPRGPQGPTGKGLTILGHYDTEEALRAAVTAPEAGDAYGVGTAIPYDTYIFDGLTLDWKNYGPLSGGGGGVLPENVVTADGGASMTFPLDLGDGPHTITFTDEEEPPLTAEDVTYDDGTVKDALDGLKSSVSDGKALVASAITDKGVDTAQDATFAEMAENIGQISTGADTSDATATSFDILAGKTAYTAHGKVEGVIPALLGQTITPGTADQIIAGGQYLGGMQTIKGDPNLTSSNIKSGVSIFGVLGALESKFQATLTVKADTGAVVTATHTDGTQVEALSTNGQVVFELPKEGTWKVTAVRGVAQYNTVTIQVTSQYSAELTAALHIVYFGQISGSTVAFYGAATAIPGYALFAGGERSGYVSGASNLDTAYAYDKNLTLSNLPKLASERGRISGASAGDYGMFAGGGKKDSSSSESLCDIYSTELTKASVTNLPAARYNFVGISFGELALFGGGYIGSSTKVYQTDVYAYNASLVQSKAEAGIASPAAVQGAANENYAIFAGNSKVTAYNKNLTRTIAADSSANTFTSAARAGNYVVFSGPDAVDAYDLFLTRTSVSDIFSGTGATTLNNFAVFARSNYAGVYDPYLTLTIPGDMNGNRTTSSMASVGDYAIIRGGESAYTGTTPAIQDEAYQYV